MRLPPFVGSTPLSNLWDVRKQPRPASCSALRTNLCGRSPSANARSTLLRRLHDPIIIPSGAAHAASSLLTARHSRSVCSRMPGGWMAITRKARCINDYTITMCAIFPISLPRETSKITAAIPFRTDGRFLLLVAYVDTSTIASSLTSLGSLSLTSSQRTLWFSTFCMPWQVCCLVSRYFTVLNLSKAHFDAATRAKVDHHDISVGNIIIVRKSDGPSVGYLIDWELAKFSEDRVARAYEKTVGTIYGWNFCLTYLLLGYTAVHGCQVVG